MLHRTVVWNKSLSPKITFMLDGDCAKLMNTKDYHFHPESHLYSGFRNKSSLGKNVVFSKILIKSNNWSFMFQVRPDFDNIKARL